MSLDSSLKERGGLKGNRSVLTRTERIMKMQEEGKFSEDDSPFGLPKLAVRHSKAGQKSKKEEAPEEGAEAAEATDGDAPAASAKE